MRRLFAALAVIALAAPAYARSGEEHVAVYGGEFEVFGSGTDQSSAMLGAEYRFADQFNGLRPVIGGFINDDSAAYGYAGAYWDLPLGTEPFIISPGFAVGGYHGGDSKDLGYGIEFRSTIEVAYKMDSGDRIGVALSHLSNAGLGDHNPGVETLQAVYSYSLY
jgi:hypothetical protein